jgi:hypothetical protein
MKDIIDSSIISNSVHSRNMNVSDLTSNSTIMQEEEINYIIPTSSTNLKIDVVKSESTYY